MRIVTGNDLATGDVTWWTGQGWSRHIEEAVDAGAHAEAIAREREIHRLSFAPRMVVHGHGAFAYEAGAARTPQAQPGAPRNIPYEAWSKAGVDPVAYSEQCARGLHGPNPPVLMPPA